MPAEESIAPTWAGPIRALLRSSNAAINRWALALPRRVAPAASVALVGLLLTLVASGAWVSIQSRAVSSAAQRASSLNDLYQAVQLALIEEEALLEEYRLSPSSAVRQEHQLAASAFVDDLAQIYLIDADHRSRIAALEIANAAYSDASHRLFEAVVAGDMKAADTIAAVEVAPIVTHIKTVIDQETANHRSETDAAFQQQLTLNLQISQAAPVVVLVILSLIAFLALVLHVNRRARDNKSTFLAGMSHELRTPLNSILGFAELMVMTEGDAMSAKQHRYIENIRKSGQHLLGLINDVLDFSKVEAGKMDVSLIAVTVDDLIAAAFEEMSPIAGAKGLLLLPQSGTRDLTVSADPMRLRQVLLNGLSNAIKFTDSGSISITTMTSRGAAIIDITDTGRGIPASELGRMLHDFEQLDNGLSRSAQGTGLGLPLSKRLVELMGGRLWLTSREGRSTTFHVRLPLAARPTQLSQPSTQKVGPLVKNPEIADVNAA